MLLWVLAILNKLPFKIFGAMFFMCMVVFKVFSMASKEKTFKYMIEFMTNILIIKD
jgi:fumarate reductase subunit C